jgi:hypothetical protein
MSAPSLIKRVTTSLVGLKMPRAVEVLDVTKASMPSTARDQASFERLIAVRGGSPRVLGGAAHRGQRTLPTARMPAARLGQRAALGWNLRSAREANLPLRHGLTLWFGSHVIYS